MPDLLEFLRTHEEAFRSRSRLASLYSDFRYQRQTNPDGFHANASTWLRALTAAAKAGLVPAQTASQNDHFVLHTGEELARALQTPEHGRPLALGSVLEEAVRKKELIPMQDFLDAKQSIYAKSRIPTPWDVFSWGLRQLGIIGGDGVEDRLVTGNFVIMANVEAATKAVLDQVARTATSNTSRIFSRDLFAEDATTAVGVDALSARDLSVLLVHLARDHAAIAYDSRTGTIKFKAPTDTVPPVVQHEDITIASLRTLVASLEPQIQELMKQVSQLDFKAREMVASKQVTIAKNVLRQKKLADTKLQQRTATLAQVEDVYAKIEQAADQVEIVRVMEASSQTLRTLNQKTGGVENVQNIMEGVRDEMMNTDEIQQALNDVSAGAVDEGEVEDELAALETAEREKREEAERAEREKQEAIEAEATRRRLAELDSVAQKEEAPGAEKSHEHTDDGERKAMTERMQE